VSERVAADAAGALVEHPSGDLMALTAALVRVPSVHPGEGPLTDALEARLGRLGALDVTRVGNTVIARSAWGRDRRVLLGGHIDTVPPAGNEEPTPAGDALGGVGTADMKGSVAVMLSLAEHVTAELPVDVTFCLYDGEEVAEVHNGLRRVFAERRDLVACDLAILMEPTGGWVEAGCQGTIHVRAVVRGARAHTARPWMGVNAVHRAVPILDRLAGHAAEVVEVDGLEYREALQVVALEAGVRPNVVPDECVITVNRRFAPTRSVAQAVAEVRALLDGADEVEVVNESPAAPPNLADPLVAGLVDALGVGVRPKLGWTDVARFAAHGIPAVNFGAGDPELAHTPNEQVTRAELESVHAGLARFLGIE
jgi:succinyl-diaminopimelate desuccinylase